MIDHHSHHHHHHPHRHRHRIHRHRHIHRHRRQFHHHHLISPDFSRFLRFLQISPSVIFSRYLQFCLRTSPEFSEISPDFSMEVRRKASGQCFPQKSENPQKSFKNCRNLEKSQKIEIWRNLEKSGEIWRNLEKSSSNRRANVEQTSSNVEQTSSNVEQRRANVEQRRATSSNVEQRRAASSNVEQRRATSISADLYFSYDFSRFLQISPDLQISIF